MSAYFIAQIRINDPEVYKSYLVGFMPIFERHKGELLVTTSQTPEVIEGDWPLPRIVVLKFPDLDHAHRWHNDPDYQSLASHRHNSADTNMILVEGIA